MGNTKKCPFYRRVPKTDIFFVHVTFIPYKTILATDGI